MTDPMEKLVAAALDHAGIEYDHPATNGLDFHLTASGVHVETKRFHSQRLDDQMRRASDVIALQGERAVMLFCRALGYEPPLTAGERVEVLFKRYVKRPANFDQHAVVETEDWWRPAILFSVAFDRMVVTYDNGIREALHPGRKVRRSW